MRKLILFLSCLMLVTTWTGMAQAVGVVPCPEMVQAANTTGFCDEDQAPTDCDRNCPRHLGCHGHQVGTPVASDVLSGTTTTHRVFGTHSGAPLAGHDLDQALRPPKA